MAPPLKGYAALRKGRHPSSGRDCFLTICLRRPTQALLDADLRERCLAETHQIERDETWRMRCVAVMPDHLHLLVTLGEHADLSAAVRLLKGRLAPALRPAGAAWQPSFFDRRLRPDDELLSVFLYIFLNPYRQSLVATDQTWAGYYCAEQDWKWFGPLTKESRPEPAWLK